MFLRMIRQSLVKNVRITSWSLATLTACAALTTMFFTVSMDVGEKMSASLRSIGANAVAYPGEQPGDRTNTQSRHFNAAVPSQWAAVKELAESNGAEFLLLDIGVGTISNAPAAVVTADLRGLERMTPYWAVKGRRAAASDECMMGSRLAGVLKLKAGATVDIDAAGERGHFHIAGVFESGDEDEDRVFLPRQNRKEESPFTYALLSVPTGEQGIISLNGSLAGLKSGIQIKPLRQVLHGEQTVLTKINLLAGLALATVLILSSLGVTASVLSRMVERRKELALLQALGARRRSVTIFLLSEGAALGVTASAIGYVIGNLLSRIVVREIFHVSVTPHFTAFLAAAIVTVVMALFAVSVGARQALRMETAVLLKGE